MQTESSHVIQAQYTQDSGLISASHRLRHLLPALNIYRLEQYPLRAIQAFSQTQMTTVVCHPPLPLTSHPGIHTVSGASPFSECHTVGAGTVCVVVTLLRWVLPLKSIGLKLIHAFHSTAAVSPDPENRSSRHLTVPEALVQEDRNRFWSYTQPFM